MVQEVFFVVKDELPVTLGRELSEKLGMIKRLASVSREHEDTNAAGRNLCNPAGSYVDVFRGLEKVKIFVYNMKVKPGPQGIVRPGRKLPVTLQENVKCELQKMENQGVLTKVKELTEWASYMIVAAKKDKVRICIVPDDLNRFLRRKLYPMTTMDDIAIRIARTKVFSALDASSRFWQIELHEDS